MCGAAAASRWTANAVSAGVSASTLASLGPVGTAMASSFLDAAGTIGRVTINERIEAGRRERRVLARVCRAAWRLEQAEREQTWALVSARAEGISIRTLAGAAD